MPQFFSGDLRNAAQCSLYQNLGNFMFKKFVTMHKKSPVRCYGTRGITIIYNVT